LAVQVTVGSSTQVPVVVSQVGVQVTNPSFPHVDRAAQRVTLPLQFVGMLPSREAAFTAWATQLTNCPWFLAFEQQLSMLDCSEHLAASQSGCWARIQVAGTATQAPTRNAPTSALRMANSSFVTQVPTGYTSPREE
jgi:hypothetical protein